MEGATVVELMAKWDWCLEFARRINWLCPSVRPKHDEWIIVRSTNRIDWHP